MDTINVVSMYLWKILINNLKQYDKILDYPVI